MAVYTASCSLQTPFGLDTNHLIQQIFQQLGSKKQKTVTVWWSRSGFSGEKKGSTPMKLGICGLQDRGEFLSVLMQQASNSGCSLTISDDLTLPNRSLRATPISTML